MEVFEALQKRRSIRKFTDEKVSKEHIDLILHAAMSGPSACNRQPWDFYVVTKEEKLKELKSTSMFTKFDAPLAIVVCGNLSRSLPLKLSDYWIQDCSAATENILLAVTALSLGAVWCGVHPQEKAVERLRKMLDIPKNQIPLNVIFIGHPIKEEPPRDQYNEKYIHRVE